MMKKVIAVYRNPRRHWVGDGFPVRSLFSYDGRGRQLSPFLLLDYVGPHFFAPAAIPRGVAQHPHRGFETVTIVYDGELAHRDSAGNGGVIGPGDVQWMTAGGGILHEEFHSPNFTKTGGTFRLIQFWVNLLAKDKNTAPSYQSILAADIPTVNLPGDAGKVRVIAGKFGAVKGPAKTFTPVNVWDVRLNGVAIVKLDLPVGHSSALIGVIGQMRVDGSYSAGEAEMVLLSKEGREVNIGGLDETTILVLSGEPLGEPIVGYGPFVMNSQSEIRQAMDDLMAGRFGRIDPA